MSRRWKKASKLLRKHHESHRGKGRLDLHELHNMSPYDIGYIPFPEEMEFAKPLKNKSEDLFIYGASFKEKTTIELYFKRRPLPRLSNHLEKPRDDIEISFKLDDGDGNRYSMAEREVTFFNDREYRGAGFAYEVLQPNKIARIKFRGYLRKNLEETLVYVQIRFLCLFFSKTFDHHRMYDPKFVSKELKNAKIQSIDDLLDNKLEQHCQIKGTFKVEDEEEREMFFLGTVGKRYLPVKPQPVKRIIKLLGFNEDGIGFQLGLISSSDQDMTNYRYGFLAKHGKNFRLLKGLKGLSDQDFYQLNHKKVLKFKAKFRDDPKSYTFELKPFKEKWKLLNINGVEGLCLVEDRVFGELEEVFAEPKENLREFYEELDQNLVVSLEDEVYAPLIELTGGKGASLAELNHLATRGQSEWIVPRALIVTSSAYHRQINSMSLFREMLINLELRVSNQENVEAACEEMVQWFADQGLNESIKKEFEDKMDQEFGVNWEDEEEGKSFAVRSSATIEDSVELSAAGQMSTFLGVKGLNNLFEAIIKCWASQFAFVPIEYKRSYGQALNSPMAVVIQEMVDCDAAGVIFTMNPIDGDERILTVTSNFGLGESVVSASVDPDTFQLSVQIEGNSCDLERKVDKIVDKVLGKKSLVTRLNQDGQVSEEVGGVFNELNLECKEHQSIEDEDLIRLGNIALKIQKHYKSARDIEWGIKYGTIYIFQSRPITNLDSNFTTYELMHELDTPHMSEFEIYSRAHWGENLPGATSWGLLPMMFPNDFFYYHVNSQPPSDFNPFKPLLGIVSNQLMFNLIHEPVVHIFYQYPGNNCFGESAVLSFFGHHITDPEILHELEKFKLNNEFRWSNKLRIGLSNLWIWFNLHRRIQKHEKDLYENNRYSILNNLEKVEFEDQWFLILTLAMAKFKMANTMHGPAAVFSMFCNHLLRKCLGTSHPEELEHNFNQLMARCNDVISAEVPNKLQEIAREIRDKESFGKLSDLEALEILHQKKSSESGFEPFEPEASRLFQKFLQTHGHRGYKEFDPLYQPWLYNPFPCIQAIKSLLNPKNNNSTLDNFLAEDSKFDEIRLSWWRKTAIRKVFLPLSKKAVCFREQSKSLFTKHMFHVRESMIFLSAEMVQRGILPEEDLIYYLKLDEIQRLTNGECAPGLIWKARQRKRLYPEMNRFKFDEFVKGFRMRPKETKETIQIDSSSISLKGTAVTVGSVKARVCVAESIDEAANIEPGDILITYSTDIGWSPYFPLLGGIVTEIGGTISHGAIIAREYGIPCLIAVENACNYFVTGEYAYLDTKSSTIVKVL